MAKQQIKHQKSPEFLSENVALYLLNMTAYFPGRKACRMQDDGSLREAHYHTIPYSSGERK